MTVVQNIVEVIEKASEPSVMTKAEAIDFYKEIIGELEMRIEALRDEIRADDK